MLAVEVVEDDELDEPLPPEEPLFVESTVSLHFLTSCTAGWPLLSVIGVRVMIQVSVIGPIGLKTNRKVEFELKQV